MITLTTPPQLNTILGGSSLVAYDHFVLQSINIDVTGKLIKSNVQLTSTASPEMDVVSGTLLIQLVPGTLLLRVDQLDLVRKMNLTAGQKTAIQAVIDNVQNALESGLITITVVAGTQAPGV